MSEEGRYLLSYDYDGCEWCVEIHADDMQDAQRRVWAMRGSLRLDGESVLKVKVAPNWLGRLFMRARAALTHTGGENE